MVASTSSRPMPLPRKLGRTYSAFELSNAVAEPPDAGTARRNVTVEGKNEPALRRHEDVDRFHVVGEDALRVEHRTVLVVDACANPAEVFREQLVDRRLVLGHYGLTDRYHVAVLG